MSWMPGAVTFGGNCSNNDGPREGTPIGIILHVNAGPDACLWKYCNTNSSNVSTTFQVRNGAGSDDAPDGQIEQYLDSDYIQWCQEDGNNDYLSIEVADFPQNPMTPAQVASVARIVKWASDLYGFPLQIINNPGETGFGWHGMGGDAWGGHTGCPGDIRKAQMPEIISQAQGNTPTPGEVDMVRQLQLGPGQSGTLYLGGCSQVIFTTDFEAMWVRAALCRRGQVFGALVPPGSNIKTGGDTIPPDPLQWQLAPRMAAIFAIDPSKSDVISVTNPSDTSNVTVAAL